MKRFAWPSIFIIATLSCWLSTTPCLAQSPPANPQSTVPATTDLTPLPAPRNLQPPNNSDGPAAAMPRVSIPPPRRFRSISQPNAPESAPAPDPTSALAPAAGDLALKLNPTPLDPDDLGFPINLATALRLSDARPLIVAAAQASVWVAEAQLKRARVLWVPTLNLGFDYIRHDGGGPDFNKGILTSPSVNFFYGGGGLVENVALTDIIFQPLAARQALTGKQADIQTAKNDALLQTANAYFSVHQYRGMYAGALYAVERGHQLIERITKQSKDLVPKVEIDRAKNLVADLEQRATFAKEAWRVHSADLTQVLRLDPRAVVVPLEHDHLQLTLIDPARPIDDLMQVALTNRPELAAHQAVVQEMLATVRREKVRPLTPTIMIQGFQTPNEQIQAGIFGLGPNSSLNQWTGRVDLSYQPLWQLEGLGIANLARIKEQRGMQSEAMIELFKTQDRVAGDVTRSRARLQSATARVEQADRAARTAITTFNGNYEGLQQTTRFGDRLILVNRPQEVVFALMLLKQALDEYFSTVADYNRAQFEVFHALGYPAREIAYLRPPGDVVPVDTSRPSYLPPVGIGPPPATR